MIRSIFHIVSKRDIMRYVMASFFVLCYLLPTAEAQVLEKADAYYEAQQYHVAAQLYSRILASDAGHYYAAYRLAHSQRELFAYDEAEKHFGYLARNAAKNFPASVFYYAELLSRKKDYQNAILWYDKYLALSKHEQDTALSGLARNKREGCLEALLLPSEESAVVKLHRLPETINTPFQEYAPVIYGNDSVLLYTSSRLQGEGPISNRSGQSFTDQYLAVADSIYWKDVSGNEKFDRLNTQSSEASGSFTADMSRYYFTRCGERGANCKIYVSEKSKGRWQSPKMLSEVINLPATNSKHPFVTASGDSLFFVSDRAGGMGKSDIWLSIADDQKVWQKAENLGAAVNSPSDEVFPYYHEHENIFIFGSHGSGGMDLYMLTLDETSNRTAIPLSAPFNSTQDDCCMVFGKDNGYLASNRDGDFDIYSFSKKKEQSFRQMLLGIDPVDKQNPRTITQSFDRVITDYSLLLDNESEYLSVMHSDRQNYLSNGSSRFILSADVNDIMLEQLRDERALSQNANTSAGIRVTDTVSSQRILASFSTRQINPEEQVEINGRIRYANNFQEVAELRLYLLDQNGEVIKITTTNQEGAFRFINLQAASSYQIVNADEDEERAYHLSYDMTSYGSEIQTVKFENIYFDFNQSSLRNEARVALNELVSYYLQNPSLVIEINAFTDTTGNDIYNLQLSRERGLAAFNYLLEAGVDRSSLVINARGASTTASSSNAFVSQQLNRRVELFITGRDLEHDSEIVTRMLRPQVTLNTLSDRTGMSVEEIRRLNGVLGDNLQAYKPVRLYESAANRAPSLFYNMTVRSEP